MNPRVAPTNAELVLRYADHLATRPGHTRQAYLRDVESLATLAGPRSLPTLTRAELARHLATLHGRGLSGRSLARMLSAWRAFFRFVLATGGPLADDPTAGLKPPKSVRRLPAALSPDEAARRFATAAGGSVMGSIRA